MLAHAYLGLLHSLLRYVIPPPQVREQDEYSDQADQDPWTSREELSLDADTQRPFKHHWDERQLTFNAM